jgi:trehalose 2-sulfotransferase
MSTAPDRTTRAEPVRRRPRRFGERKSGGLASLTNPAFDISGAAPARRSYIVASTPRSGSTFLCTRLWATGALGAPAEYFGYQKEVGSKMMERLQASSPADYLQKLLACRTSHNGIFGLNLEFHDFDEALRRFPGLLAALHPLNYVFIDRRDRVVQAAFMARDVQSDVKPRAVHQRRGALRYDRDAISKWLGRIERQRLGWMRWFAANRIEPFVVNYDQLISNPEAVINSIVNLMGVANNEQRPLRVALAKRPSDRVSEAWAARFEREVAFGIDHRDLSSTQHKPDRAKAAIPAEPAHIFDSYDATRGVQASPTAAKRRRARHEAIIVRNRGLFANARVLDIRSGEGYWSFAALNAGAAHVVGIDNRQKLLDAAGKSFAKIGVAADSYKFINEKIFAALPSYDSNAFDVILCRDISPDPHFFFKCLKRLQPKHVILDIKLIDHKEASVVFVLKQQREGRAKDKAPRATIGVVPNDALIGLLSDYFGFRCRAVDWRALGFKDWTGIVDYRRQRRRTYILDGLAPANAPMF